MMSGRGRSVWRAGVDLVGGELVGGSVWANFLGGASSLSTLGGHVGDLVLRVVSRYSRSDLPSSAPRSAWSPKKRRQRP